jgi:hypothetical protein
MAVDLANTGSVIDYLSTRPNLKVSVKTMTEAVKIGNPDVIEYLYVRNKRLNVEFSPEDNANLIRTAITSTNNESKVEILYSVLKYTDLTTLPSKQVRGLNEQAQSYIQYVFGRSSDFSTIPDILIWGNQENGMTLSGLAEAFLRSERFKQLKPPEQIEKETDDFIRNYRGKS